MGSRLPCQLPCHRLPRCAGPAGTAGSGILCPVRSLPAARISRPCAPPIPALPPDQPAHPGAGGWACGCAGGLASGSAWHVLFVGVCAASLSPQLDSLVPPPCSSGSFFETPATRTCMQARHTAVLLAAIALTVLVQRISSTAGSCWSFLEAQVGRQLFTIEICNIHLMSSLVNGFAGALGCACLSARCWCGVQRGALKCYSVLKALSVCRNAPGLEWQCEGWAGGGGGRRVG